MQRTAGAGGNVINNKIFDKIFDNVKFGPAGATGKVEGSPK